jgi:putative ABC transport system permease protein
MDTLESIRTALYSLSGNKLRSALTMLGIIIGVAAVISLMGIGQGASQAIDKQIGSMGSNLLFVSPGAATVNGVRQEAGTQQTLTLEDANALLDPQNAPAVAAVAPELDTFGQIVYQGNNTNARVVGVTPAYEQVRNSPVQDGDFITQANVDSRSLVAVLGPQVASALFTDGQEPVGQVIRINNISFKVVGVLQPKGGSGFGNADDQVFVPITTAMARLQRGRFQGGNVVSMISVQAVSAKDMDAATQQITAILEQRHHIRYQDDFTIRSQQDLLATASQVSGVLTVFLGAVAGISLLVGGIGIMNIMLVSVTERTREIGIRKAVGATRRDVLNQFLTEATILSVLGGLVGIVLGIGVARLISSLPMTGLSLHSVVTLSSVLLATLSAIAIGLFFGIYPAFRASALNPIDALHYE